LNRASWCTATAAYADISRFWMGALAAPTVLSDKAE